MTISPLPYSNVTTNVFLTLSQGILYETSTNTVHACFPLLGLPLDSIPCLSNAQTPFSLTLFQAPGGLHVDHLQFRHDLFHEEGHWTVESFRLRPLSLTSSVCAEDPTSPKTGESCKSMFLLNVSPHWITSKKILVYGC